MKQYTTREPDFSNLAAVLERQRPARPTLFEFYLNHRLYQQLAGDAYSEKENDFFPQPESMIIAYKNAGYDYATIKGCDMTYKKLGKKTQQTHSLHDHIAITDWDSFEKYPWPEVSAFDYSRLNRALEIMPPKMKLVVFGAGGVLENVITLLGYENLCMLLYDDRKLVEAVFEKVGSSFVEYYSIVSQHPAVGAILSNDDWGFNTQTMLSLEDMRNLVFPWHKQIVAQSHTNGKYAILHSCGCYDAIIDDVIDDMKYDARHSYEDSIIPVEQAYPQLRDRISVLGGIDIGFMSSGTCQEIHERASALVEQGMRYGGYALGTGNSIPEYVPDENYYAMINTALNG